MSQVDKLLIAELLEAYRLQRHDFLNHWQVVSGYMQINRGEKALQYIRSILPEFEAEQKAGQIPEELVSACVLRLIVQLHKEGIPIELKLAEGWKEQEFWTKHWREEYLEALYGYTSECLEISLSRHLPLSAVLILEPALADAQESKAELGFGLKFRFEVWAKAEGTDGRMTENKVAALDYDTTIWDINNLHSI